ncbi:MAG: endopeptidase La [candidate division Zixibacteria bacterium]|jgi:ATP-dependent Lon protease|nr:endopeptidase La [candidate division Zixibacteria bacterium]
MLIPSHNRTSGLKTGPESSCPVLPLMTGVLFPGTVLTIQIGRSDNLTLVKDLLESKREFAAAYARSEVETATDMPMHEIGVFALIRDCSDGPGGSKIVTLEGRQRAFLKDVERTTPYLTAVVQMIEPPAFLEKEIRQRVEEVIAVVSKITHLDPTYSPELSNVVRMNVEEPSMLADRVASAFHFSLAAKQEILESVALDLRYERLLYHLNTELARVTTLLNINENVKQRIKEEQQRYFLRQQLHEIKRQLGEDFAEEREAARFRQVVKDSPNLPPEVISRATIEIDRLGQLSPASAEYGVTRNYLDWLLNLPWNITRPSKIDMTDVERVLTSDYYGPVSLKEQIMQRLSVRKLLGGNDEGPTLCLVGAPGTGKASLAKAIAKALGKEFIRISVGGIDDVAELRGHPRTFLGAYPGRIVRTLREASTCDPLVLIEDIDYFNLENDATVNMALLEVIDSRRNARFLDHYIGVPMDLSRVFFICSVRSYEEIPEQFVPRLEILDLPGYIEREKIVIAKRYIIPKVLKRHGLLKSEVKVADKTLSRIITAYTQEAGLLGFSQQIEKICRKVALEKADAKRSSWMINEKNLESYLGTPQFIPEKAENMPEIGIATGLAWTGSGGELMFIEALKMKGEGQIITTGSLGEVMRESIIAAHSYVRSKADTLGIDFSDFSEFDIHVHFPSGAIPKDGPSAGVTVSLVIASVMSERPIRNDMAMTGEVTLRGRVLPVGGIKEKVSAAYRAGILHVAMPKENAKDIKDLPREILRKTRFYYIERVDELFELCLLDFTPSSFTLEKIFAEEIERAKRRKKKTSARRTPAAAAKSKRRSK